MLLQENQTLVVLLNENTVADEVLIEDEEKTLATSETCEVVKLADVSVTIKNLIKGIEANKSQLKSWKNAVNKNDGSDIQTQIDEAAALEFLQD